MPVYEKPIDPSGGVNNGGIVDLGNGLMLYTGTGVFTTTGTTCVINHPFGTNDIFSIQLTPMCNAGSEDQQDQPLYVSLGTTANLTKRDTTYGTLKSITAGKTTIARLASGSSALAFCATYIGRARH